MDFFDSILKEDKFLAGIRQNAILRKIPVLDNTAGRFLQAVCFLKKPEKILEIGCGIGYSTYFLLKHFSEITEDTKTGDKNYIYSYTGIDLNKKRLEEAEDFINKTFSWLCGSDKININFLNGNALKIIPTLSSKYDFIFIDAAKFEYPEYLAALEPKMQRGSLLIADNVFYSGKIFNKDVSDHDINSVKGLKKFIYMIKTGKKYSTDFFNISDGISLSVYK
ncbi:MAG: class I SAM-dependent methyltransferase [Actinobacteria bacterium]|nr:class I SAM-dependent methyltransferase [Actinomycetota bacterium]